MDHFAKETSQSAVELWPDEVRPTPILFADGHTTSNAPDLFRLPPILVADGHTASNAQDLFQPPNLSGTERGEYWGGPPRKSTSTCTSSPWPSGHRSHFGSRYKLGCCGHAGLCRKRPASICHITSLMTTNSPARPVTSTLLLFAPFTCM